MAGRAVVLTGDTKLDAKLLALKTTKMRAAVRKGTRAGAKVAQAEAKGRFPVLTGKARRGIKVRALPRSRRWIGHQVRLSVFYAAHVEYGTKRIVARNKLKETSKVVRGRVVAVARDAILQEVSRP